jgi:hypothetical protein
MTNLRTLILVLALCGVAPTASADDFWTASMPGDTALFGAPAYGTPAVVAPAVVGPAYVAPSYGAPNWGAPSYVAPSYMEPVPVYGEPPCDDYRGYDDHTDLLLLDQLETMNQTLRDIESHMRQALRREAWDRMLGRYRN